MPSVRLSNRVMFRVSGADAQHFLHNLVTTDIDGLPAGEWRPGALLSAQGKVQFAFLVARDEVGFSLECDARDSLDFYKRLKFYKLRAKVDFTDPIEAQTVVTWKANVPASARSDARFGATLVSRSAAQLAGESNDQAAWISLRIEHGVAEPHDDYSYGDVFPHDVNLDQTGGISFKKGCYVGQEVVSRMQHRSTARWRLMVANASSQLTGAVELFANAKPVGRIGSVSGVNGLALVRLDRVCEALDANVPILADKVPVRFEFPQHVTYGWPQPVQAV